MIPVLNLTMADRIVYTIARTSSRIDSFVSDEVVEVFCSSLAGYVTTCTTCEEVGFIGYRWSSRT